MSKLCGIWNLDFRRPSWDDEVHLRAALGSAGYSGAQIHRDAGIHLGWAAGSESPPHPGVSQSPEGVCAWDGRLDNATDLLVRCGLPAGSPESAIVLSLYGKNGVDGLGELVGDFGLSLWDSRRRAVVLAGDYAGVRPLYYRLDAGCLRWSSSLADLVLWTGATELDEQYVAQFLIAPGGHPTRTPYAGIASVPAGQAVTITPEGAAQRRFWNLPLGRETRYRDERQYEEHLLEIFGQAVRTRMGGGQAACAELSGGLDSSSVVTMANRLRQEMPERVPQITSFSYIHENSTDEKFLLEVERACGLPACHFELRECPLATADMAGVVPAWWEPRYRVLARRMAERSAGVLMTGQLGDLIMGNLSDDTSEVAARLAQRQFRQAVRGAYSWARAMQVPIYPILWRGIREAYFSWVPSVDPGAAVGAIPMRMEDSLTETIRRRLEHDRPDARWWRRVPPGQRTRFRAAAEQLQSRRLQAPEALQHLSYTHPYADRPLVEFMLTVPMHILVGPNQPRRLMRRAFAGLLPRMVLNRRSKAEYGTTFRNALVPLASELLQRQAAIQLVERGYVERQSLVGRLEAYTQGLECNEMQLQGLILLEFWLRNRMPLGSGS